MHKKINFSLKEVCVENQMEILKLKSTLAEIKNANTGCWESLDRIEETLSNIEDGSVKKKKPN